MDQVIPSSQALQAGMTKKENGKEYVYLYVASSCVKNTPYTQFTVNSSGVPVQSALQASAAICKVVVATKTLTAAGYAWFQTKGVCLKMITPSITSVALQTLKLASSAVAAGGATTITPDDFAISYQNSGTGTTQDVYLLGREITPS